MSPPTPHLNRPRATFDRLTIAFFLLLIWLPTADFFLHVDHARPTQENRAMAMWPAYRGLAQLPGFLSGFEAYFNDHFGFRKQLIRWSHHWKEQLFQETGAPQVLSGRDGWLFFSGGDMVDHVTRAKVFSAVELENWRRLLEARREWCAAHGCAYVFVVPPDKQTIYPEFLPDWLRPGAAPSKVEQLANYLKAQQSDVCFVDLSTALRNGKKTRTDYLKTDTHWNLFGAFCGYRAVIDALTNQLPQLRSLPENYFTWQPTNSNEGDLVKMEGNDDARKETEAVKPIGPSDSPALNAIYDDSRLPQHTNTAPKPLLTLNPQSQGKAVVFHDSYGASWRLFFGHSFREVLYLWRYGWNRPFLEKEKPDLVIDEMLERYLNVSDPVKLLEADKRSEVNDATVISSVE